MDHSSLSNRLGTQGSALSLPLPQSLMPAELEKGMGHEEGVGGEPRSADVKCEEELTCCVQNISQV